MAISNVITAQTGGREAYFPNFTKYSQFLGGVNSTHHALLNYSPLMNGFGRLFMVRPPLALLKYFSGGDDGQMYSPDSLFMQFKHMTEYMLAGISGFGNKQLQNAATPISGGYAGRNFNTPTTTKDTTETINIRLFDLIGSPVYTVIDTWMNIIGDENSGYATYGGFISGGKDSTNKDVRLYYLNGQTADGIPFNEAYHTAEFIYVLTDRSGAQVERAVMLADVYPTELPQDVVLNMDTPGQHDNVQLNLTFNCEVYRSPIINAIANDLLKQYRIVSNSLNFNPELGDSVYASDQSSTISQKLGAVPMDSASGTNTGNVPVYYSTNAPVSKQITKIDINATSGVKQAGFNENDNQADWASYLTGLTDSQLSTIQSQISAEQTSRRGPEETPATTTTL